MSLFRRAFKKLYEKLFPQERVRTFNEQPTRPMDAEALARALAGEGRRHVSTGCVRLDGSKANGQTNCLYLLMAQSDGLNALPDFGILGVAEYERNEKSGGNCSKVALSAFAHQITQKAALDFLELEGYENPTPLQNIVLEAMNIADQSVREMSPASHYSLTAGLIFAEIIILGHRGDTRAYHIDNHHIERITGLRLRAEPTNAALNSNENQNSRGREEVDPIMIYSRPIPRDGYILLCTGGLWKKVNDRLIHETVLNSEDPQEACKSLISLVKESNPQQRCSIILLYFPPDFGSWH